MADLVESVLAHVAEKEAKLKTTEVHKDIEVDIDDGNLLVVDSNPIDLKIFRSKKEICLLNLARDNTQLLINRIWELPVERVEDAIVAKLPPPKTILPREKPVPSEKPKSKWTEYAQLKGIQNKKRGRKVWDDQSKEWKPSWGYKRANDPTKDWMMEVPDNADPYEDQFEKVNKAKKERVAKNELQRLRNIARNMKGKMPSVGVLPTDKPDKSDITRALHVAQKSTASVGKFTEKLAKEKPAKGMGKKRKFESNFGDMQIEKKRVLDVLGRIQAKKPTLNVTQAANQHMSSQDQQRANKKGDNKTGQKGQKGKGKKGGPPGGGKKRKGQPNPTMGGSKGGFKGGKKGKKK